MDTGKDYDVRTRVSFKLDFDGSGELNLLALPDVQRAFAGHVQNVFQQDDTLGSYVQGDLTFQFDGRRVDLESFGCKLTGIHCTAEEADMTWLDRLEDAVFGPGEMEMR